MSEQEHPLLADLAWRGACKVEALEATITELRAERDRLREALERLEEDYSTTRGGRFRHCVKCYAFAERSEGKVSVAIPHRPTCPFSALREREEATRDTR